MGIGDQIQVMNIVVNKLCNNIKFWHRSDKILEETLEVFCGTVSSYSSSKTLLNLETVNFLVHNHVGAHFPSWDTTMTTSIRHYLLFIADRLVFSSSERLEITRLMCLWLPTLLLWVNWVSPDLRTPAIKTAIVAALRDLRGITVSAYNKRTYNLLFEALYPQSFPLLLRVAETWYDDPIVMTALLKFMQVVHLCFDLLIIY